MGARVAACRGTRTTSAGTPPAAGGALLSYKPKAADDPPNER
jgi:hypothetical protein